MPSRAVRALVAGVILAFALTPAAWAPDGVAAAGVAASFDRRAIARGQVAVAEIAITNRGPDPARGLVVEGRVDGGRILRARAEPGFCAPPRAGAVRCSFRAIGFGSFPGITLDALPDEGARRLVVAARIVAATTRDPAPRDDSARASVPIVARNLPPSYAEISFVLTAPATARLGRPFAAILTLLNRGPATPALVGPVEIVPVPATSVRLSPLPRMLRRGEQWTVRSRITPARRGPLAIRVRVGSTGRATAVVRVR